MHLFAYVQRLNRFGEENESQLAYVSCFPVARTEQQKLRDQHIARVEFVGRARGFTPGTLLKGECEIVRTQDLQTADRTPSYVVDEHGQPVMNDQNKPVVRQGIRIRWTKLERERVPEVEEIVSDVQGLSRQAEGIRAENQKQPATA